MSFPGPVTRREFVAGLASIGVVQKAAAVPAGKPVTPEMFGAKGDGRTNDTKAFAAMSDHVNAAGGGTIVLRRVTYLVGEQHPGPGGKKPSFAPVNIINLIRCTRPIVIVGNGAKLLCAPGLRYGRFDPASGEPLPKLQKRDFTNEAIPYHAMVYIHRCSGSVEVSDLELDGNLQSLRIGGKSAGNGWQAGATGMRLGTNTGPERISRVHTHHHAQDGLILNPSIDRTGSTEVTDVVCEYNGRQGCSVTGGRNINFHRCKFNHTGRAVLHSSPSHGVDIEAELQPVRDVAFYDCEFSDNFMFGVGAGKQTDIADVAFTGCRFIGTTNFACKVDTPGTKYTRCTFVGATEQNFGVADKATQFVDCTFTDNPALSPTKQVFLGRGLHRAIVVIRKSPNTKFSRCHFRLVDEGLLPKTGPDVIYSDCDMSQRSAEASKPRGIYLGTNVIKGNADLEGSTIRGKVTLNGRPVPAA
jgi:hypothetical protein